MRADLARVFDRNLGLLDAMDATALADASAAWRERVDGLTSERYATERGELVELVATKTIQSARWFAGQAREHVAAELDTLAPEARRVANGAASLTLDRATYVALADDMLARIDVGDDPGAALARETPQLERIIQTESFTAYNRTRDAMIATLLFRGDQDTYRVRDVPQRDVSDWVPAILKRWSAVLDKRVCPTCAALDNAIRPLGMPFDGGPDAPLHPRCRCVVGFWPIAVPKRR